jgi:transposase
MGFREVGLMQVADILRRWQAGDSARAIARGSGLARDTVGKYLRKYLREARTMGLTPRGPAPTNEQLLTLAQLGQTAPPARAAPRAAQLEPHRERIVRWLQEEKLQLTRIAELLEPDVAVPYTTLRRFVRAQGLAAAPRDTVRMADTAPGEVAEFDFGRLGRLTNPTTGKYQLVWAMNIVLVYSRHQFVWPLIHQTLEEVIGGLEATWRFWGGIPRRIIFDNFPAAVAGADALNPVFTRGFLEYSQARGFIADPARARHPKDKPHTERNVQYVRERLWKGGSFADLADAREQAKRWCLEVAGVRIHGTTRKLPLVIFREEEQAHLLSYDGIPYAVPAWGQVTVHPDHHISFRYAIYSVPDDRCPVGARLEVRADRDLVRIYNRRGELVKTHPRQPKGGRHTDPADYPAARTPYALRDADYVVREAAQLGQFSGLFAERLLAGDFPWAKLRQGQKLIRLGGRYTATRLNAACERALAVDLIDVTRVERMLIHALEQEPLPIDSPPARSVVLPSARFAREASSFDHRHLQADHPQGDHSAAHLSTRISQKEDTHDRC